MARLSRPVEEVGASYDVVVVGSGYGGAIAAARLARRGRNVCVLERGREFRPENKDFPDEMTEAAVQAQARLPDGRRLGFATGLFDLRLGDDMNVMVACGLGGTSLINGNVAAKPDPRVFDDERWPKALRADVAGGLEEGYLAAAEMLRVTPYAGPALEKLSALEKAAGKLGGEFVRPLLTVNMQACKNAVGIDQAGCTLCGDCCSGCNVGAKSSTLMTYLPDAVAHGASVFTEAEVLRVARAGAKWQVFYRKTGGGTLDGEEKWVEADIVVLGAGALGSTEILLRSKAAGLPLSSRLGQGFTGNGDVLAFAYNNDEPINGIGRGQNTADHAPVGPCITGMIDLRAKGALEHGMVIEEGALPSALAPILPAAFAAGSPIFGTDTDRGDWPEERLRELDSLARGPYHGAVANTQTLLVMAHDDGKGELLLDDDRLRVSWPGVGEQPVFQRIQETLLKVTAATGGTLVDNPLWSELLGKRLITVHPLGGCAMGETAAEGVVDDRCRVFADSGSEVHEGLYVCDGSVMPRSLGVNPLWTISAVSERAMDKLVAEKGWAETPVHAPVPAAAPPIGLKFSERMSGWIGAGVDFAAGAATGKDAGGAFSLTCTVTMADIDAFLGRKEHLATLSGTVEAPAVAPGTLLATGTFNLFKDDAGSVETKRMEYDMRLVAPSGARFRCFGFKAINDRNQPFEVWTDTTTLYVTVWNEAGAEVAKGILHLSIADFMRELRTIRPIDAPSLKAGIEAVGRFAEFFGLKLWDSFGGVFLPDVLFDPAAVRPRRQLRLCAPEVHMTDTKDGKRLMLTRYKGGERGVVLMVPGLGVSSRIYAIDSVDTNMAEYLYGHGYDLWLFDWRASIELPYTRENWTGDEAALYDYPAAVDFVRQATGGKPIDVMAHCVGAITFTLALLRGTVNVRSMVVSQVSLNPIVPVWPTRVLAYLGFPSLLRILGVTGYEVRAKKNRAWWEVLLDKSLTVLPWIGRGEPAQSATHRRVTGVYGPLYQLANLNQATMDALPEVFGVCNSRCLEHMTLMARASHVVPLSDDFDYMKHLDRLAIPTTYVHGDHNQCFIPEGTARTIETLSAANGSRLYERHLIQGYGHIDCMFGKNAVVDVFPLILKHLEKAGGRQ